MEDMTVWPKGQGLGCHTVFDADTKEAMVSLAAVSNYEFSQFARKICVVGIKTERFLTNRKISEDRGRAHYTDAGAAKLSGDLSQSPSDAPLTGLAGPVEIPKLWWVPKQSTQSTA
jgi:hypothetical protein